MKEAEIPVNEPQRLYALQGSGLLELASSPSFDRLTRLAQRFFQVPLAMVNIVDEHALVTKSLCGQAEGNYPRNIAFCSHAILSTLPLVVTDTHLDDRFADNPLVTGQPGIRFYAGMPLSLRDGTCVGALCLIDYAPRTLTEGDLCVLRDLAALVENEFAAISAATTDELTGLLNRRGFNQFGRFALSVARRRAEPLTLGWLDLDHFKQINDSWGHEEGDKALKALARLLQATFRETDLLVRYGGDEFAVLFADTDEQGGWIAMNYLTEQIARYNARSLHPWSLSCSWGVSEFDHQRNDLQQWLKEADEKMFAMKRQRNAAR